MPISPKYLKILKSMSSSNNYCNISKYGELGRIDKTIQGIKTCKKSRQVFYAKMNKEGIDYRKELALLPEDVKPITPKIIKDIKTGLYLTPPHGQYIWEGEKSLIIKSKKFTSHVKEDLILLSGKKAWGKIYLEEPKEINKKEFDKLYNKHKITEKEYKKWNFKEPLYSYKFRFTRYDIPKNVKIPKGVQVFVDISKVKFLDTKSLSDKDLEIYHIELHLLSKYFKEDILVNEHNKIVEEFRRRHLKHVVRDILDRIEELIKEWKTYDPSKIRNNVLLDDNRIVFAWASRLKKGKKLESEQFRDYNLEEQKEIVRKLHRQIKKEMIKRGMIPKKKLILFELPPGKGIKDIDIDFVKELSNKKLISLYKWLHKQYRKEGIFEDLHNANVFVGIELRKRGLYLKNKIDDKLTEATELEISEYPTPKGFSIEEDIEEPEELTIEELYNILPNNILVPGQPYAIYQTGRIVNEGKVDRSHDLDWVFRQYPDRRIIEAIKRIKPNWLSKRIHVVFDPSGPLIGFSKPIYRYGFFKVPRQEFVKGFGPYRKTIKELVKEVKPFMKFRLLKQASGWEKNEFWNYESFYKNWASKNLDRGIYASKKYDGRAYSLHSDGKKVMIITEDTMRDRASEFPNIVKELLSIKGSYIFHAELVGYDCKGKQVKTASLKESSCEEIPREDTAYFTVGKISPEQEAGAVFHVHDCMYYNKSLTNEPYCTRLEILQKIIPKNLQYIAPVQTSPEIHTPAELKKWTNKLRRLKGSEGVFYRTADAKYPIKKTENRSPDLAKIKNLKSIDVMVWERIPKRETKTGKPMNVYMYESYFLLPKEQVKNWRQSDVVQYKGKYYARIGRSYAISDKLERGDILEVLVGRIRFYKTKEGKEYVTWMFPKAREQRKDKTEPDTLETVRKLSKVGPGQIVERLSKLIYIKLSLCPFYKDKEICPLKMRFGMPRHQLSRVKIEYLKFPIACPLANLYHCRFIKKYYYGTKEWRRMPIREFEYERIKKSPKVEERLKVKENQKEKDDLIIVRDILLKQKKREEEEIRNKELERELKKKKLELLNKLLEE